jgi:fructokinase
VNIVSIGEVLWDLVENVEHLGGAPYNFSAHLAVLGHKPCFISAVGEDQRGNKVLEQMARRGLSTRYVRRLDRYPTGTVTVNLDAGGQPQFLIHRPAAYDFPELNDGELRELTTSPPDWVYFGTLVQTSAPARKLTRDVLDRSPEARRFYDVNLRPGCYDDSLVRDLLARASIVKVNEDEVGEIEQILGERHSSLEDFCRSCSRLFRWEAVCVTRGADGCALLIRGDYVSAQGYSVKVADTVGAGDAFAAAFVHGFGAGWSPAEIADFANRVGAIVASRPGATPQWSVEEVSALRLSA